MPLNGSGAFAPVGSSVYPAVTTTDISSTDFNALMADVVTALSTAMYKDGQQTPTANITMGGFKLTGLAAATTAGDALRYQQRGQFKVVAFSRSESVASGTQAVTGVGFTPKSVVFLMGISGNAARASIGVDDGTTPGCIYGNAGGTVGQFNVFAESIYSNTTDATTTYQGHISSFDADGFTLTWIRTGVPASTLAIKALCFA